MTVVPGRRRATLRFNVNKQNRGSDHPCDNLTAGGPGLWPHYSTVIGASTCRARQRPSLGSKSHVPHNVLQYSEGGVLESNVGNSCRAICYRSACQTMDWHAKHVFNVHASK